jgi:tRNA threonylcarbamoyl adenosine modification protein YeaZ
MAQKYALAIHTASSDLGLAIGNGIDEPRIQVWENLGRDLSTQFHTHLSEFLFPRTWADLNFIAVAKGPGGFTGTRLGVVAARTLAQQLELPLFAISTLAIVAWNAQNHHSSQAIEETQDIAVQMPAQRGELHTAIYSIQPNLPTHASSKRMTTDRRLTVKQPDIVMVEKAWLQTLENWHSPYHLIQVEGGLGNTVSSLLELAYLEWQQEQRPHWSEALPFYGQSPV